MMKKMKAVPLVLSLTVATALVGCESNSSSTTRIGASPVISPDTINKEIEAVEWDGNNDVVMASHAYRVVSQNSMLRAVFTNQLSTLDVLINLFRLTDSRECNISGRMVAEEVPQQCYTADGSTSVDCNDDTAVISVASQLSQGVACQDGVTSGRYFDGFFNITSRNDETTANELRTSSTISAVGEINQVNASGEVIVDGEGDPVTTTLTDYIFQNDSFTFFFSNEYVSYVDFDTNGPDNLVALASCTDENTTYLARQGMRSDAVAAQETTITDGYSYVEYSNLDLAAVPTYSCSGEDIETSYSYSLTTTLASVELGGGTDGKTQVSWPDLNIPLTGNTEGTMTLTHTNAGNTPYVVTVAFDGNGNVTITSANTNSTQTVAEFFALSKLTVEE